MTSTVDQRTSEVIYCRVEDLRGHLRGSKRPQWKYPEKFNSVEIVSGYKDYYIIQFENEQDTQVAYEEYKNTSYITDVDVDSPVYLRNGDVTLTSEEEPHEVPKGLESWGGYASGTYDVKKYIEDNNLGTREIVVGVLDTGVEIENEFLKFFNNCALVFKKFQRWCILKFFNNSRSLFKNL